MLANGQTDAGIHEQTTSQIAIKANWLMRIRGRRTLNPANEPTDRVDAGAAAVVFVLAYLAALPFMNTTLIQGAMTRVWHGADIAYFVNFGIAALLYGVWRLLPRSRS